VKIYLEIRCIICNGVLEEFSEISNLDLPVNFCKNCNLYINGNTKEQVIEKVADLYKGEY